MRQFFLLLALCLLVFVLLPFENKDDGNRKYKRTNISVSLETDIKKMSKRIEIPFPNKAKVIEHHHEFTDEYIKFAREIGGLKRDILNHPQKLKSGLRYFQNCTNNDELTLSVRALCLSNIYYFRKKFDLPDAPLYKDHRLHKLAKLVSEI